MGSLLGKNHLLKTLIKIYIKCAILISLLELEKCELFNTDTKEIKCP